MVENTYTVACTSVSETGRDTITLRNRHPDSVVRELNFHGHIYIITVALPKPMHRDEAIQCLMAKGRVVQQGKRRAIPWTSSQLIGIREMLGKTPHRPLE